MVRLRTPAALLFLLAVGACSPDAPSPLQPEDAVLARGGSSAGNRAISSIRASTARYHSVDAAIAAGYLPASPCVSSPAGGMGIHYVNAGLVDDVHDPAQPEALLYEPTKNGKLRLVAVEFLHTGETAPESSLEGTFTPSFPGAPWKLDLHAWVWQNNPAGMYEPFNPNVSCEYAPAE